MVSGDEKEEPFVIEKDQCWVEAYDSRTFGPVSSADIVGRASIAENSCELFDTAMERDSPILAIELDVEEMAKNHKAQ
ncbi:hypothetical protein Bca52824_028506 [Brassica carinata]|uniref:Uncharacterized protein n=1 Tax=Brassica carinata TaxID=52824 RepID=A0A8X7VCL9_BRACI|nr:hypothetical protein Bca52824_028506 [Brassica carinata]